MREAAQGKAGRPESREFRAGEEPWLKEERIRGQAEKEVAAGSGVGLAGQAEEFGPQWTVTGGWIREVTHGSRSRKGI